jgi:hypothetical protein
VVYECADCGRQVSVIAGTILEQSKKPLALWFRAIFEVTASKQGISAAELQRKLGLGSYQTAWSWPQKIRSAMVGPNREPLAGEVEIDESYLGGAEPGKPGRAWFLKVSIQRCVAWRLQREPLARGEGEQVSLTNPASMAMVMKHGS